MRSSIYFKLYKNLARDEYSKGTRRHIYLNVAEAVPSSCLAYSGLIFGSFFNHPSVACYGVMYVTVKPLLRLKGLVSILNCLMWYQCFMRFSDTRSFWFFSDVTVTL